MINDVIPKYDIDFINEYISVLRENCILLELVILNEEYFYSIFIIGGEDIINNDNILKALYEIDNRYREIKSKNIHTNYSSKYLSREEISNDKKYNDAIDITSLFNQD